MDEDQLRHRLDALTHDEPPPSGTADALLAQAQRRLRRHRIATGAVSALGASAVAVAGVSVAMSEGTATGPGIADAPSPTADTPRDEPSRGESVVPSPPEPPALDKTPAADDSLHDLERPDELVPDTFISYPKTRELLYAVALEHFDPARDHLGSESGGGGSRIDRIAEALLVIRELGGTNPDESGTGRVEVGVSTPGLDAADVASDFGCVDFPSDCPEQGIPGTDETAYIVDRGSDGPVGLAVIHERPDGSFAGVAVYCQSDNNRTEPVSSSIDIDLEQAFAFVTDDRLQVHPSERDVADQ